MRCCLRRGVFVACALSSACFFLAETVSAHVGSGGNCARCHTPTTGRQSVTGNHGLLSVDPRLDGGATALLKSYTVRPGEAVQLTFSAINGGRVGDKFAFSVTGTLKGGALESLTSSTTRGVADSLSNLLAFTPDSAWTAQTPTSGTDAGKTYFSTAALAWSGATTTRTYDFLVSPDAPFDVYSLTLRTAGKDSSRWSQNEEILLNVVPEPAALSLLLLSATVGGWFSWVSRRRRKN